VGTNLKTARVLNEAVIRPLNTPYSPQGGIAILRGNLAPDGAVVKQSAVAPAMQVNEGKARVFDSEDRAIAAILGEKIKPGDIVVIRYEGPKGGPGMREMLSPRRRSSAWAWTSPWPFSPTGASAAAHRARRSATSPRKRLKADRLRW